MAIEAGDPIRRRIEELHAEVERRRAITDATPIGPGPAGRLPRDLALEHEVEAIIDECREREDVATGLGKLEQWLRERELESGN